MNYFKADYNGSMIKCSVYKKTCLYEYFFSNKRKLVSKLQLYEFRW